MVSIDRLSLYGSPPLWRLTHVTMQSLIMIRSPFLHISTQIPRNKVMFFLEKVYIWGSLFQIVVVRLFRGDQVKVAKMFCPDCGSNLVLVAFQKGKNVESSPKNKLFVLPNNLEPFYSFCIHRAKGNHHSSKLYNGDSVAMFHVCSTSLSLGL